MLNSIYKIILRIMSIIPLFSILHCQTDTLMSSLTSLPADAISGLVRKPHVINPDKCIKCGMCMARCKFKAILVC